MFSALINQKFPDRKLYLYDSFESFNQEEYEKEIALGYAPRGFFNGFKNTSEADVLKIMKYPDKCRIRKGYFPESIKSEDKEEKFVFVSLDVDFEEFTLEGLRFFYPRLVEGGYIFLHDYHNHCLFGVKRAVERFEAEVGGSLKKVPISDEGGTLVIVR
ncbi:MAG: methyltransferase [Lachnospiraceae bacterium]|nr:methyltransferase [Lachnospiraceae bacterium]